MPKTIKIDLLSPGSLDAAIKQIDDYKRSLAGKCESLAEQIAERVAWRASEGFATAVSADIIGGPQIGSDVTVTVESDGKMQVVIASGEDAVFIEFGAGVYDNGAAGSSPHPKGAEHGFLIGEYGLGRGKRRTWGYYENGELVRTHGTPAAMPMYHGLQDAIKVIADLAREVFAR